MPKGDLQRGFTDADLRDLDERGIGAAEAERQLDSLRSPSRYVRLVRACTVGDGIERIAPDGFARLHAAHAEAGQSGMLLKFVPASGAATRMFSELLSFLGDESGAASWPQLLAQARSGGSRERALVEFVERVRGFAFYDDLERVLRRDGYSLADLADAGAFQLILEALLGTHGLDYGALPKGLLKFHAYPEGPRTSFEEHLVEAADYVRDAAALCRLHLTVSPDHRVLFEELQREVEQNHCRRLGVRFEVGYSVQKPATDTIAINAKGELLRDVDGRLRFRPGGHGALIENLNELHADIVFIKNIDNVQHDRVKTEVSHFKRALAGRLLLLRRAAFSHLDLLRAGDPPAAALESAERFAREELHVRPGAVPLPGTPQCRRAFLIDRLNRPLRVCGVVPNTGEPGGGPFWVRAADGSLAVRIVESAEVDPHDADQQCIWRSSTHFNPVDLVCALRAASGRAYDLHRFIDEDAVIVASKTEGGRTVRVLERPGLWNGAMAGWNTALVEVPLSTFSPVKTVLDLLREEHRAQ